MMLKPRKNNFQTNEFGLLESETIKGNLATYALQIARSHIRKRSDLKNIEVARSALKHTALPTETLTLEQSESIDRLINAWTEVNWRVDEEIAASIFRAQTNRIVWNSYNVINARKRYIETGVDIVSRGFYGSTQLAFALAMRLFPEGGMDTRDLDETELDSMFIWSKHTVHPYIITEKYRALAPHGNFKRMSVLIKRLAELDTPPKVNTEALKEGAKKLLERAYLRETFTKDYLGIEVELEALRQLTGYRLQTLLGHKEARKILSAKVVTYEFEKLRLLAALDEVYKPKV